VSLSLFVLIVFLNTPKVLFYPDNVLMLFRDKILSFGFGSGFPISLNQDVNPLNFEIIDNTAMILGSSEFISVSPSSKIIFRTGHSFSCPLMKKSRCRALISDCGGNDFKIVSRSKVYKTGKTENNIISSSISEIENYCFLTDSDGYCCEMVVFGLHDDKKKYRYCFSQLHAVDIAINESGKNVAVCGFYASDNEIKSVVQIFDIESKEPKFTYESKDNILISLCYFSNNEIVAIGDRLAIFVDSHNKIKEFNYDSKQFCLASIDKDFGLILSLSATFDERNQQVFVLKKNGKLVSRINTEKRIKSLFFAKKRIMCLSENQVSVFDVSGNLRWKKRVPVTTKKSLLISNSKAFLLGNREISLTTDIKD
jgi:hypothetical protein